MLEQDQPRDQIDETAPQLDRLQIREGSQELRASLADDLIQSLGVRERSPEGGTSFYRYIPDKEVEDVNFDELAMRTQTLAVRASSPETQQQILRSLDAVEQLRERVALLADQREALMEKKSDFTKNLDVHLQTVKDNHAGDSPLESSTELSDRVLSKVLQLVGEGSLRYENATAYKSPQAGSSLIPLLEDLEAEIGSTPTSADIQASNNELQSLQSDFGAYEGQYTEIQERYEQIIETLYELAISEGGTARKIDRPSGIPVA